MIQLLELQKERIEKIKIFQINNTRELPTEGWSIQIERAHEILGL